MSGVRVKRNGDRLAAREHKNMKLKFFFSDNNLSNFLKLLRVPFMQFLMQIFD